MTSKPGTNPLVAHALQVADKEEIWLQERAKDKRTINVLRELVALQSAALCIQDATERQEIAMRIQSITVKCGEPINYKESDIPAGDISHYLKTVESNLKRREELLEQEHTDTLEETRRFREQVVADQKNKGKKSTNTDEDYGNDEGED